MSDPDPRTQREAARARLDKADDLRETTAMLCEEVLTTLRAHETVLRQHGVVHAAVFGSVARGEEREGSDVDVLVELDPARPLDIYAYVGLKRLIGGVLPRPADVIDLAALKEGLSAGIRHDAIYAF